MRRAGTPAGRGEWQAQREPVDGGFRYRVRSAAGAISFAELFRTLEHRDPLTPMLAASEAPACFWELPPLTRANVAQPAEFVLIDAPALAHAHPSCQPFDEAFTGAAPDALTVCFENLGGDGRLIAPRPLTEADRHAARFAHLVAFVREASETEAGALWRTTAREVRRLISDRPLWVSTSGLGVIWLHVRLDQRPKYYTHEPYLCGAFKPPTP